MQITDHARKSGMNANLDTQPMSFIQEYKPTWKDKIRYTLFPFKNIEYNPPIDFPWKDCIHSSVKIHFSFMDRIKLLFTGRAILHSKTACENEVGRTYGMSQINVVWK